MYTLVPITLWCSYADNIHKQNGSCQETYTYGTENEHKNNIRHFGNSFSSFWENFCSVELHGN